MTNKNMYVFKSIIRNAKTNEEIPLSRYRILFSEIIKNNAVNNAITLSHDEDIEPITLDIVENTDEYLFCKLNKKKPNNTMQKRNYTTQIITDVLSAEETKNSGVELFTYCIIGYSHGIVSIINSKGAPNERSIARLFARYKKDYLFETEAVPNNVLIRELLEGQKPQITKVHFEVARPNLQFLEKAFGFKDKELLEAVSEKTSNISITIKPEFKESLLKDKSKISSLIGKLRDKQQGYLSVRITGKSGDTERQREYDLYEEYFKYPISVKEYRQEGGRRVEVSKDYILKDYKKQMMKVYSKHKNVILAMSNRL